MWLCEEKSGVGIGVICWDYVSRLCEEECASQHSNCMSLNSHGGWDYCMNYMYELRRL